MVSANEMAAIRAFSHGVGKAACMTRSMPDFWVLDDGGIEADDGDGVAVRADGGGDDHVFPPAIAQVVFKLSSQRAEIPKAVITAIDVGGLEDEAAAFA